MPYVIELLESSRTKAGWLFNIDIFLVFMASGFQDLVGSEKKKKKIYFGRKKCFLQDQGMKNVNETTSLKKYIYNYITDFLLTVFLWI